MVCATFNTILLSYDCDTVCSLVVPKSEKICQILDMWFCEHLEVFGGRNLSQFATRPFRIAVKWANFCTSVAKFYNFFKQNYQSSENRIIYFAVGGHSF